MPRIFDNIEHRRLPELRQILELSAHSDLCVGYFNLRGRMGERASYSDTTDQASLTAAFDLHAARTADSFDKCYRELTALLTQPLSPDP